MRRTAEQLRSDALAIWQAGVDAVRSDQLVRDNVQVSDGTLLIGDEEIDLNAIDRILAVGGGKAGAGMAQGLESALGGDVCRDKRLTGWVNVPADCVRPLGHIHLCAARPAGVNEPTAAGVAGTREILALVESAGRRDLCIVLISGGGSALLPAPIDGVALEDKQAVTRLLSAAGADIQALNTVRKRLSRIKGGGLARACRGRLIALVISDVLGDPLDVIASGPTVADSSTPEDALTVLAKFDPQRLAPAAVYAAIEAQAAQGAHAIAPAAARSDALNIVIGNNAVAVDAAGIEAERRGYRHAMHAATQPEGDAEDVGRHLARMAARMRDTAGPDCLITGGEPVVRLVDSAVRGRGGRNQQLVLAALQQLAAQGHANSNPLDGLCLLSGGTDGEDGPTDAAGALVDASVMAAVQAQGLDPGDYLRRNDAYGFFEPVDGLLKTGPTDTNVCDVRVVVVDQRAECDAE